MGEVADLYLTLRANTAQFTSGWAKAVATGETSAAKINAATGKIAKYSVLGLLGVGVAGIKMASDFEAVTLKFTTTAGESARGLAQVRSGILDLTSKVGISAKNLADAMYYVESGGFHGASGLRVLADAAKAAQLEGSNVVDVAHALAGALNDYRGTTLTAVTATNAMTAAVGSGMMTFQDLAEAMPHIGARAAAAHVQFQEMLAGIGTMTKDGLPAAVAATYLGQTIGQLAAPTSKASKEMQLLGLNSHSVAQEITSGSGHGLADAINAVWAASAKAGTIGQTQVQALALMTGGVRSYQGALMLGGAHAGQYAETLKAINKQLVLGGHNVAGWADRQHTFQQRWDDFSAGFQADLIRIGQRLLPTASSAMQALGAGFDWVGNNIGTIMNLAEYVAAAAAGFYALKLATLAWSAIQWISSVVNGAAAFVTLATEIRSAKEAQVLLSMAMSDTPWGAVASLVGVGMLAAFKLFHKGASDASKAAQVTQQSIDNLRFSYDKLTGAIKATSLAQIQHDLQSKQFTVRNTGTSGGLGGGVGGHQGGYVEAATSLGIQSRTLDLALIGNADALKYVNDRLTVLAKGYGTTATTAQQLKAALVDETGTINANADAWRQNQVEANFAAGQFAKIPGAAQLMTAPLISTAGQLEKYAAKWHWSADQVRAVATGELVPITKSAVDQVISNLAKLPPGIASQQPATNAATRTLANGVLGPLNGLSSLTTLAGQNAGAGLAHGLSFSIGGVINAAASLAAAAYNTARAKLQIHSPSRVFFEIGANVGDGFSLGIDSRVSRVSESAIRAAAAAKRAAGAGLLAHHRVINGEENSLAHELASLSHRESTIASYASHNKTRAGRDHAVGMVDALIRAEQKAMTTALAQQSRIERDGRATRAEKARAVSQVAALQRDLTKANDLHTKLLAEQIKAHTATAAHHRRESARKALAMDLPTYLEAAAAAGYTTYGARPPGGGGSWHHTTVIVQLDRKVLAQAVQKEFLLKERRGTSNGLSRRRSAKV